MSFSADALLKQIIVGGTFLAGALLAWADFPGHAVLGQMDVGIMLSLASIYVPLSIVLCSLSIGLLCFYTHDRAGHEANLAHLRQTAAPRVIHG